MAEGYFTSENNTNHASILDNDPLRATIDEVWAILHRVAEQQEENEKRWKKTEEIVNRNSKQMGDLHRRFGELAEHLVAPSIHKRFNELGYHFGRCSPGGTKIFDEQGKTKTEIDLLLENGETIIALEVKTKPALKDEEHHIKRLEILRVPYSARRRKRRLSKPACMWSNNPATQ